jgi:hypothetical protein
MRLNGEEKREQCRAKYKMYRGYIHQFQSITLQIFLSLNSIIVFKMEEISTEVKKGREK